MRSVREISSPKPRSPLRNRSFAWQEQRTQVAKADETRLRTLRNYVTITAPFAGTVTKRYANVGSMIQAGIASQSQAMPLVRLSQISTLRLSLPVPESLVPTIRVGQPVEVQVKSLGTHAAGTCCSFRGKVGPVDPNHDHGG